MRHKLLVLTV